MKTLERVSQFAGNTFAVWVLLFAALAFFIPDGFTWIATLHIYTAWNYYVRDGNDPIPR